MTTPVSRRPALPWELLERHLDEAEFLWTQWERGLWDSALTLEEVAGGDEGRLRAHLDALVVAGAPAAWRLLRPALESEEPARVAAAAWALLAAEDADWRGHLLQRLEDAPEAVAPGVLRALELSERAQLQGWVLQVLPRQPPALQAGLLRVLRLWHVSASSVLGGLDVEAEPALHAEALRAVGFAPPGLEADALLARGLEHALPAVRDAALETGLLLGSRGAWEQARSRAAARAPLPRAALLALAVAGEPRDLRALVEWLEAPETREEALWALGFSGRLAAAEALLPLLRDEALGALAAESFAAITGLPLAPPYLLPVPPPEDEEAPEVPEEDLQEPLPRPPTPSGRVDGAAVARWWTGMRGGFAAEGRYLRGAPLTLDRLASALEDESMRRRPGLAWELTPRSGGTLRVESRLWTSTQRQQARALAALRPESLTRGWSRLASR